MHLKSIISTLQPVRSTSQVDKCKALCRNAQCSKMSMAYSSATALTTFLDEIIFSNFFPTCRTSSWQLILYVVVKIHFNNSSYGKISTVSVPRNQNRYKVWFTHIKAGMITMNWEVNKLSRAVQIERFYSQVPWKVENCWKVENRIE